MNNLNKFFFYLKTIKTVGYLYKRKLFRFWLRNIEENLDFKDNPTFLYKIIY